MHYQKSKKILFYIFLFLFIGTFNNKNLNNINIPKIDKINIVGLDDLSNDELISSLNFLKINNLFFLNKIHISKIISSNNLVEDFSVFKKYPSSIYIKIIKTKFLAQVKKKDQFFLLGSNGKFTKIKKIQDGTPFIFGDFDNKDFFNLIDIINKTNFDSKNIKSFFSFPSGRWDIETKSGLLIRLPSKNIEKSFENFKFILDKDKLNKIKSIDMRQLNQIITYE